MKPAFYWNLLGFFMWGVFILVLRYALERRRQFVEEQAIQSALDIALGDITHLRPLPEVNNAY
jgi:heme exporter protein C